MLLIIFSLGIVFLAAFIGGFKRIVCLGDLHRRLLLNMVLGLMIIFTLLATGTGLGLFTEQVIARFTEFLYIFISGFFFGYGLRMFRLRKKLGAVEYVHRSFWTDVAPNILSILLIAVGLYQTGIFSWGPFSEVAITSGLSLVGFGFFGFTIRIVPEFRRKGILILDQKVAWPKVVAYKWKSENVLEIDYYIKENEITGFSTYIPSEDELRIEKVMGNKLREFEKDRKKQLDQSSEHG